MAQVNKNKEKRIDKEIFLLRNLPEAYKLGKKLEQQEMMKDPEKYKAYLLEELKNQQAEKPGTSKKLDSLGEIDTNSTPPDEGYKDDVDVMDELFG